MPGVTSASPQQSASPAASDHFGGWEAEEQLSARWGSAGSSFSSQSGSGHSPPLRQPWLGRLPRPVAGAGSLHMGDASRPGSPGDAAGSEYMQYTVRSDSILGAPAGGGLAAQVGSTCDSMPPLHAGVPTGLAPAHLPPGSPASEAEQHGAAAWAPYPPLYGSQGWPPGGADASEQLEGSLGSHAELEDEPSAPPLPGDQSWADDGCSEPAEAARSRTVGGPAVRPGMPAGGAHGRPPCTGSAPEPCDGWGAAGAVSAAAAADWRWTSESSVGAPPVAEGRSRQVSVETGRYQALLETLAARRREALGPAAAGGACTSDGSEQSAAMQGLLAAGDEPHPASSTGREAWLVSPLLRAQAAPEQVQAPAAQQTAHRGSPARAKWAGVQTLLTNLSKSADGWPEHQQVAGLSFWEQPVTEEEEGEAAVAPCRPDGSRSSVSHPCSPGGAQPTLAAEARLEGRQSRLPSPVAAREHATSAAGPCSSASPPSPAARLLLCARQWVGSSPAAATKEGRPSPPPRGLAIKFGPLGVWAVGGRWG